MHHNSVIHVQCLERSPYCMCDTIQVYKNINKSFCLMLEKACTYLLPTGPQEVCDIWTTHMPECSWQICHCQQDQQLALRWCYMALRDTP